MKIVQSYWSRPMSVLHSFTGGWPDVKYYWYAWVLSAHQAKATHGRVELVTDRGGASLLVDQLGLPFDKVDTVLDEADAHPGLWKFGKLLAYAHQDEPFLHIESDVFLWKRLPEELLAAPLLIQHIELPWHPGFHERITEPRERLTTLMSSLPPSWTLEVHLIPDVATGGVGTAASKEMGTTNPKGRSLLYQLTCPSPVGASMTTSGGGGGLCCGVLGGHDLETIHQVAREARSVAESPGNRTAWLGLRGGSPVMRGTYPNTVLEHYTAYRVALERDVDVWSVFPPGTTPMDDPRLHKIRAEAFGFTHVMGEKKTALESGLAERLENRVRQDYPGAYERVQRLLERHQVQPTPARQAGNMLRATARAARSIARTKIARKRVSNEDFQKRVEVCRQCPGGHVKMRRGDIYSCGPMLQSMKRRGPTCGCFLKLKARDPEQDCPQGFWPKLETPTVNGNSVGVDGTARTAPRKSDTAHPS